MLRISIASSPMNTGRKHTSEGLRATSGNNPMDSNLPPFLIEL